MNQRLIEGVLLSGLLALVLISVGRPIWNIDLFWHMAAGEYIVTTGTLPTTDIFSAITPERSWVTFQWGYEVLVYLVEQAGGLGAIRALHALVMLASFALMWWACRYRLNMGPWASIALTLLVIVLFGDRIRARPHIFNLMGWVIALPWLVRGPALLNKGAWLGVALLSAAWANLHAGGALIFLIAAGTLPAGALISRLALRSGEGEVTKHADTELKQSLAWYACAVIPALASPLFVRGNLQALTTFSDHEGVIGEWQPSWHFLSFVTPERLSSSGLSHLICGLAPTLLGVALLALLLRHVRRRDERPPLAPWRVLFVLAMVVLGHRSVRFVYVATFGLAALMPMLRQAGPLLSPWRPRLAPLAIAALAFASYGFNISAQHPSLASAAERVVTGDHLDERRYPVAAADFLVATGFKGHIFCQTNWGGYLRWRLGDTVRVIADGRANFSAEVADDLAYVYAHSNLTAPDAGTRREAIYTRYDVDLIVHQHPVWPAGHRPDPSAFLRVFADARGEIWLRNTPRGAAYLQQLKAQEGNLK